MATKGPTANTDPRRSRAVFTLVLVTTCVVPLFVLPYVATRRKLSSLERKLEEVSRAAVKTQLEIKKASAGANAGEFRLRACVEDMRKDVDLLRQKSERERESRLVLDDNLRHDMRNLQRYAERMPLR